jgi:xanthine dehydrogenase accessory factor
MVVGHLPVASALAQLARAMSYQVVVVDPDHEGVGLAQADEIITDIDQMAGKITSFTYVVVASHGHYDEIALTQALRSKAPYVALVASKTRAAAVLEYLRLQGLSEAELARLKYPAGLDIQARRGDEIALSIMAEIVQRRRNAEPMRVEALLAGLEDTTTSGEAIDPVCGMTVQVAGAEHQATYRGQTFYFCCEGCQASFERDPGQYLDQPTPAGEAIDPVCGMAVTIAKANYMSEYGGQFYYFCAAGCKSSFDKEPQQYVKVSNVRWSDEIGAGAG